MNFPFLDVMFLVRHPQLIRFSRVSSHVDYFITRNKAFIAKLLKQGICRYHNFRKAFSKFYRRHFDLVSKYNAGLTLLLQGLLEPEFYGDLVYKFRKIISKNEFPNHSKKVIVRYKWISYNIDVCGRLHPWLLIQSRSTTLLTSLIAYFFDCTTVGRHRQNDGAILNLT